jgi:hypothetical protein
MCVAYKHILLPFRMLGHGHLAVMYAASPLKGTIRGKNIKRHIGRFPVMNEKGVSPENTIY